ncbi:MAG: sulfatase-like hydrolase/transferase [Planctomycetes bacterium]|nr:sulfatase-like hydrolase/transferase [Planctomycetota bacterium]
MGATACVMRRRVSWMGVWVCLLVVAPLATGERPAYPPNIIIIIASDLGYGDLGCYGQTKIRTPNIDKLAAEGIRFTRHYAGGPTNMLSQYVLLTGEHPGHTNIRDEVREPGAGVAEDHAGLNDADMMYNLRERGFACMACGVPMLMRTNARDASIVPSFSRTAVYYSTREARTYYPHDLQLNGQVIRINALEPQYIGRLPDDVDPNDPRSYARYKGDVYAPEWINGMALALIRVMHDQRFCLYYPMKLPSLPLAAPDAAIKEYEGKFPEKPYTGGAFAPQRTPHAAYAAMVTLMDENVGRIVAQVEDLGLTEKTIILFTSANGPMYDNLGGSDCEFFNSTGGLRGRKGSLYEGGIRVPLVIRWPGHIRAGMVCDKLSGFEDLRITLASRPKVDGPLKDDGHMITDGIDLFPILMGEKQEPRPWLYRETSGFGGQAALWMGQWKGIRTHLDFGLKPMQLYDLANDPGETHDLAQQRPDITAQMHTIMRQQHTPSADFPMRSLDEDSRNHE